MLRRLAFAGLLGTLSVGIVAIVSSPGSAQNVPPSVETRAVCGPVAGPRARCHAIQVLNPGALVRAQARGGVHGPPSTTSPPATTSTTTGPTTTTTAPTTTTTPPTTTTQPGGGSCTT